MSLRDDVLHQAMALPLEDRAFVVMALENSLDVAEIAHSDEEMDADSLSGAEFLAELERRSTAYRAGTMSARDAADVIADLKKEQTRETSA